MRKPLAHRTSQQALWSDIGNICIFAKKLGFPGLARVKYNFYTTIPQCGTIPRYGNSCKRKPWVKYTEIQSGFIGAVQRLAPYEGGCSKYPERAKKRIGTWANRFAQRSCVQKLVFKTLCNALWKACVQSLCTKPVCKFRVQSSCAKAYVRSSCVQ